MTLSKAKSINHGSNNNSYVNSNHQECADCGSRNTQWASLNHGVIICDECCLAHRNLGRCISIIKSLRKSYWPQSLIDTLYELVRNNSNQIWEANLSNLIEHNKGIAKSFKKPSPKDSNTVKLNFIKMKYENLAFISRNGKYSSIEELNQQLVAAVKTNNYELTLRILAQGADANYRSQEDGNQLLHTAVLHNQIGQIELLCLYGADVGCLDRMGQTPLDLAKQNSQILDRLNELQFELTDELSFFLCNKRPDHKLGKHFLIQNSFVEDLEMSQNTKLNFEQLPDHLFEELCKDIYDELDRRQIETIWKSCVGPNLVNEPIPFLIIKSCFTQTRNQLRQKLARFNANEFSSLLTEILKETERRYESLSSQETNGQHKSISYRSSADNILKKDDQMHSLDPFNNNDEDPLYDKVPSDEDYASVASESSTNFTISNKFKSGKNIEPSSPTSSSVPVQANFDKISQSNNSNKSLGLGASSSLVANAESTLNSIINSLNRMDCNAAQSTDNYQANERDIFTELKSENELMQAMIERLMEENAQLRADKMLLTTSNHTNGIVTSTSDVGNVQDMMASNSSYQIPNNFGHLNDEINLYSTVNNNKKMDHLLLRENFYLSKGKSLENGNHNDRMFENYELAVEQTEYFDQHERESFNNHEHDYDADLIDEEEETKNLFNEQLKIVEEEGEKVINKLINEDMNYKKNNSNKVQNFKHEQNKIATNGKNKTNQNKPSFTSNSPVLPGKNSVIKKMKKITKTVQDLFKATKESEFHLLKDLCDKVNSSVHEMIILFPDTMEPSNPIHENLVQLDETCKNLVELVNSYHLKISTSMVSNESTTVPDPASPSKEPTSKTKVSMSTSSSSSSALSNGSSAPAINSSEFQHNQHLQHISSQQLQDNLLLKNMIISNLVNYSYEIAHTVKRIVCIMGADN